MAYGKISDKQREILEYIKKEILNKGYPPTVRDICEAVHLKSTSSVHSHLETLEKNGYIRQERSSSCSRSYYVGEVEEESIKAKYENGVLALYIPKQQDKTQKTHSITIE